jgi:hypothetical protein
MRETFALALVLPIFTMQLAVAVQLPAPQSPAHIVKHVQQGSCSRAEKECVRGGASPNACASAKSQCLKTGTFIGPTSGNTFGPLIRK